MSLLEPPLAFGFALDSLTFDTAVATAAVAACNLFVSFRLFVSFPLKIIDEFDFVTLFFCKYSDGVEFKILFRLLFNGEVSGDTAAIV